MDRLQPLLLKNIPFTVEDASLLLNLPSNKTAMVLARYERQGHLKRIKRGLYIPIAERFLTAEQSLSDPWKIVPSFFSNGYVGGWSAANFWQLTEQIFDSTVIFVTSPVPHKECEKLRFKYILFQTSDIFGIDIIWRDNIQVHISDPHRTILDMIQNPISGGGIQHTLDCFKCYTQEQIDENIMLEYAKQYKKGSFFKRLGFIVEKILGPTHPLCILSKDRMTKGYAKIDTSLECTKLITPWNLFINGGLDI